MHGEAEPGRVTATIQANLRRSPEDARRLAGAGIGVRLVKGAYLEHPADAIHYGQATDRAYLRLATLLGSLQAETHLATHHGLLRAACRMAVPGTRFELGRRRASLTHLPHGELDDLVMQAADDAMVAILAKLDSFRGESRFTTWAYKFALLEAGVKARRRIWQGREVPLEDDAWSVLADTGPSAHQVLEENETLRAIRVAVHSSLTQHQRAVFVALALNDVPIDVLAERLDTTRGALYKAWHDARRKLRAALADELPATETPRSREVRRDH